ncbi:MAG: 4Fe-4S ferredoxin [Nitrospira sp.]|nr:4Fe-4S ferredoxin [Nitrospira sp.]
MASNPSYGRRDFLKYSVLSVAKTAQEFSKQVDAAPEAPAPTFRADWLRPPGAVDEVLFLDRCTKCGDCIKACDPGAIVCHAGDGTPVIFADQSPCLLCDDLPCIAACATDALTPTDRMQDVRLGVARVSQRLCTAGQGCHACVSKCPMDALSMDFSTMRLEVSAEGCVGCGICEHICHTVNDHVAIRVTPVRQLVEFQ